jgi:type II secretion system protein H
MVGRTGGFFAGDLVIWIKGHRMARHRSRKCAEVAMKTVANNPWAALWASRPEPRQWCGGRIAKSPNRQIARSQRRHRAFSLIEVVVVMAIIAVVAALAVPRFGSASDRFGAAAAARRIAADLELARAQAINRSAARQVTFDVSSNKYQLIGTAGLDKPTASHQVKLADAPYHSRLVSAFSQTGSGVTVTFDGYGVPDTAGPIVVERNGQQRTVVLDAGSGRATVQ